MTHEKRTILNKIDRLISKRKTELFKELPSVHEIDDGIVIRFFTEWDNCDNNNDIRFKKINNLDNPDEIIYFMFLPKNAVFDLMKRDYIGCISCLSGKLEINIDNKIRMLENHTKICLESDVFQGKALENTYIITTNKL